MIPGTLQICGPNKGLFKALGTLLAGPVLPVTQLGEGTFAYSPAWPLQ